jgi:hypothetical protein
MTQIYDEHAAMTPAQRRALAHTASGPHNSDADPQYEAMMAYHGADAERLRRQEALAAGLAAAAAAETGMTHFATGPALDRATGTRVRRESDPDQQPVPEPVNVGVLAARDIYGLDDNGLPLPEDLITDAQRQARHDRYAGNDAIDYDEER